ncbi:MAG TPA: hypothetical protein VIM02_06900 [Rhizomicrobium sp.]
MAAGELIEEDEALTTGGPIVGREDEFEAAYTEKFRSLVDSHGLFVRYERDRAALDIGLHLTRRDGTQSRVTRTRIWFQLKGLHKETLPRSDFEREREVTVPVRLDHLKFWFAAPEPIYLAVYVEAADLFVVEDVRDIVDRQWGEEFLAPHTFRDEQNTVAVKVNTSAVLTPALLALMRRHQSMRIDGPFFRGRALGHRLDPLRCILNRMEPEIFVQLIQRLLEAHDYRPSNSVDPKLLFPETESADEHIVLTRGVLFNTLEWVPWLTTEWGIGKGTDFRIEGRPEFVQGPTAVCIHGNPISFVDKGSLERFAQLLLDNEVGNLLVFANTDDARYFGSFFGGLRGTGVRCTPQLIGDIGFSLLTATSVYMEFREAVSWRITNYLWNNREDGE